METILGYLGIFLAYLAFNFAWRLIAGTATATSRALTGNGDFTSNLKASVIGMDALEFRLVDREIGDSQLRAKKFEIKGLFPITCAKDVAFVVSILDVTEDETKPVFSILEDFSENNTPAFQTVVKLGEIQPDTGYPSWISLGGVLPDFLEASHKGRRVLAVIVRLIDLNSDIRINLGFHSVENGLLWTGILKFEHEFENTGYEEEIEQRMEAHAIVVKLGVFAAYSDGCFEDEEGNSIKEWMSKAVMMYSESRIEEVKNFLNAAFKEAYLGFESGSLTLSCLCRRLNEIDNNGYKYEAIELCYEVVAADKKIEVEEANMISQICLALKLDMKEIEKIRDRKLIGLDGGAQDAGAIDQLLGIGAEMNEGEVKRHLSKEFQKWNSRLNTLPEGVERENAQRMLDLVASARAKSAA